MAGTDDNLVMCRSYDYNYKLFLIYYIYLTCIPCAFIRFAQYTKVYII